MADVTEPDETVTEWGLLLEGDLGSLVPKGVKRYEMTALTEREARRRMQTWNGLHPHVRTTLRHRERRTYLGEWEEAQ